MREPNDRFIQIIPGIFRTSVKEENDLADAINIHFIPDDGGCLIIDTGFPTEEARGSIAYTLEHRLGIPMEKTRLFVTHSHPDHDGLAPWCVKNGIKVYTKKEEYESVRSRQRQNRNTNILNFSGLNVDRSFIEDKIKKDKRKLGPITGPYEYIDTQEGSIISRGGRYTLETVSMAGHTLHQQGVMDKKAGVLFCADQVIFGTTPSVTTTRPDAGLLRMSFATLSFIRKQNFNYILPSHGDALFKSDGSIIAALSYIENSYGKMCAFLLDQLQKAEGKRLSAHDLTLALYAETEEEFYNNISRQTVMTGKILTCLEYLYDQDSIGREFEGLKALYYV